MHLLVSIVVSIPACHAGDRGSIPRRGAYSFLCVFAYNKALSIMTAQVFVLQLVMLLLKSIAYIV